MRTARETVSPPDTWVPNLGIQSGNVTRDIMHGDAGFCRGNGAWNRLYVQRLGLAIWTWADHLEVERAACHRHLHGDGHGLKVPHLEEGDSIQTLFIFQFQL